MSSCRRGLPNSRPWARGAGSPKAVAVRAWNQPLTPVDTAADSRHSAARRMKMPTSSGSRLMDEISIGRRLFYAIAGRCAPPAGRRALLEMGNHLVGEQAHSVHHHLAGDG